MSRRNAKRDVKYITPKGESGISLVSVILSIALLVGVVNRLVMAPCRRFEISDQKNKIFLITGASSGLGLETARVLAEKGGKVIMACRNAKKCEQVRKDVGIDVLDTHCEKLEMASLTSIRNFATTVQNAYGPIDVLINNAGLMNVEPYQTTEDGFEMTMGVNHFGHFLLTQLLLPFIKENGRIVTHSSGAALLTADRLPLSLLPRSMTTKQYKGWVVYGNTKLANAYMSWELSHRLKESTDPRLRSIRSYAVHPGYTSTNLQAEARMFAYQLGNALVGMEVKDGALTQLAAAASDEEVFREACTPDIMIAPKFGVIGYPSASTMGLYDDVRSFRVWEKSLAAVGVREQDDSAPASVARVTLLRGRGGSDNIPL
jgi:NAD(P)-dependent dehydrogenase (short-subunit alcohol dehydrogenase family)